jgi:predicted ATPase
MILTSFTASKVHGYLNFEVKFNERLSFLTGINGSGKTTVLNCVQALLAPDLSILQSFSYNKIRLNFIDDLKRKLFIEAEQSDGRVSITASGSPDKFSYVRYVPDPTLPTYRQTEGEVEYFRDLMATSSGHSVMSFINGLPTPMFLGLDRRARMAAEERRPGILYRPRSASQRRLPRSSMGISLNEAEDIVVDAYRDAQISSGRVGEKLQRKLILNLITPSEEIFNEIAAPKETEIRTLERVQGDLDLFPKIFRLPSAEVNKRIVPFVKSLQKLISEIPKDANPSEYFKTNKNPPPYFDSLINWNASKSQLNKIAIISEMVSSYNEEMSSSMQPFETYKKLVNDFLKDSGKSIDIGKDERSICVKIKGVKEDKSLSALSSGEAQIFVILTNLSFSPSSQTANIFIIDEPELSLHLRWQEMFVDSVMSANRTTQFIMATHSPSIILERTKDCVDVVAKRSRERRG